MSQTNEEKPTLQLPLHTCSYCGLQTLGEEDREKFFYRDKTLKGFRFETKCKICKKAERTNPVLNPPPSESGYNLSEAELELMQFAVSKKLPLPLIRGKGSYQCQCGTCDLEAGTPEELLEHLREHFLEG